MISCYLQGLVYGRFSHTIVDKHNVASLLFVVLKMIHDVRFAFLMCSITVKKEVLLSILPAARKYEV